MSGVGVIFNRSTATPPAAAELEGMAAAITDLGRDGTAIHTTDSIGFVCTHRRDLVPEDRFEAQPVHLRADQLAILFDGRLDNRDDLRRHLALDEHEIAEMPDSELFARMWERDGDRSTERIVGPYAAIIWDALSRTLTAVRDPTGERTLHWHVTPERLLVASAPRALHACGVAREIDEVKVADTLALNYNEGARTFFKGITRLRAGHRLTATANRLDISEHHSFTESEPLLLPNDGDYVDAAHEVLDVAMRAALRTTAPPSLSLSGGLDSPLVAIAAERILAERGDLLHTYTSVPLHRWKPADGYRRCGDEGPAVQKFLDMHPTIEHTWVRAEGRGMLDYLDTMMAAADAPPRNVSNLYWIHEIGRLTRERGARVVLNGRSGNLSLGWNGDSLAEEMFSQHQYRSLWRELRSSRGRGGATGEIFRRLVDPKLPDPIWERLFRLRHRRLQGWHQFSALATESEFMAGVAERAEEIGFDPRFRKTGGRRKAQSMMLGNVANERGDIQQAINAVHGIEGRDPLGDLRVLKFAFSVPTNQYRRDGVGRWLQRRMLDGQAPPEILSPQAPSGRQGADIRLRIAGERVQLAHDVDSFAKDPLLASMIDLKRLRRIIDRPDWWESDRDSEGDPQSLLALSRGVATGRFVQSVNSPQSVAVPVMSAARQYEYVEAKRSVEQRHERGVER